ncbi:chymotrypsin inhibitor-like [Diabrotica virgifera virgifera]|uniref:Chymotrypsin inhibitor-like n=1 Tax=Diabrotica virgifera virgifera TaxID=50390 RepID=A0A6P7FK34_DIAVI|nr:chymotrypsin inhibitor-like [Diabrotica virgifera virgifera]
MKIIFAILLIFVFTDKTMSFRTSEPDGCGPNETFTTCGSACSEKNCEEVLTSSYKRNCLQVCIIGCFCNAGYIRNTSIGKCVKSC